MEYIGQCFCGLNRVTVDAEPSFEKLVPRRCDCNSCQSLVMPAPMVSDPAIDINIMNLSNIKTRKNGSKKACFLHCVGCEQLIGVVATIEAKCRGAVNAHLFQTIQFKDPILVRPYLLSEEDKIKRWKEVWGVVNENQ